MPGVQLRREAERPGRRAGASGALRAAIEAHHPDRLAARVAQLDARDAGKELEERVQQLPVRHSTAGFDGEDGPAHLGALLTWKLLLRASMLRVLVGVWGLVRRMLPEQACADYANNLGRGGTFTCFLADVLQLIFAMGGYSLFLIACAALWQESHHWLYFFLRRGLGLGPQIANRTVYFTSTLCLLAWAVGMYHDACPELMTLPFARPLYVALVCGLPVWVFIVIPRLI